MAGSLPLSGLSVIALEQAVAAPFCTSRLADAGARVIKIERPDGDFARGYDEAAGGESSYFVWLNRGKESVVLDLRERHDRDRLRALAAAADVVVQNLKPGALAKLGIPSESLRMRNRGLIVCSISGYGDDGPMAKRKAYDLLIQAESGLASITGGPSEPARVGISLVDIATGATAHAAILEAIVGRARTGLGADIHISMFDVMADWLTVPLLHEEAGQSPKRIGLAHPSIAPYGGFKTRDGLQVLISIQNDREWDRFCRTIIGTDAPTIDPRFATNRSRSINRAATDQLVADAIARFDMAEICSLLETAEIAFARVNEMRDLARHPQLRRITVETAAGSVAIPAPAPIFAGESRTYGRVPAIGENALSD